MTTKILSTLAALWAVVASATTNDLISNGSFESGSTGWILSGGAARYQVVNTAHAGASALRVFNRISFTNAPQQDVTAALLTATNGTVWTTRLAVQVAFPTTVRAWLRVVADNGGVLVTNRHLLAERVLRATNSWTLLTGTKAVAWTGSLNEALFYTESGMKQELSGTQYPATIFDSIAVRPDTDGDGLWDEEEVPTAQGGTGTNPLLRDTDGDGLPDGWEIAQGLNPNSTNGLDGASGDGDADGFSNWEEFCGDTQPTNSVSFPGQPIHANVSESARAVGTYLARLPSRATNRVIAGQHLTDINLEWNSHIIGLHTKTGYWPGLVSFAAEFGANAVIQMGVVAPRALEAWTNGAIPLIKWQMANPWKGTGTSPIGAEDLVELLNPATPLATNQMARSNYLAWRDVVANSLTTLRDAGVVVLFRPYSEMNGTWFWHGNKPRSHYVAFWRDLHSYYTTTRGLTNLLWVFEPDASVHLVAGATSSGTPIDYYYPGDDVVDVVGHNFYDNDWAAPFDSDAVWRGHGKIFAVPQAGSGSVRDGTWDNLTYLNGVTNTLPRLAFFCAWNTFTNGTPNFNAINDNLHPIELMTHPPVATRDEVNWQYELPMTLSVQRDPGTTLRVNWQGGILQQSADLQSWTDLPAAARPLLHDTTTAPMRYWRVRK